MSKNEIHARISPELMEALKRICGEKECNLSDITRAALVLYVEAYFRPECHESYNLSKDPDSLEIILVGRSFEAVTPTTPNLLDPPRYDDIIDW